MSGLFTAIAGILPSAGGGGWNPQTQGTLVNWYDTSTLALINGAPVVLLPDSKTGDPNPLTSIGGFNPTYATAQQNGLGTIQFNGSQMLETGGSSSSTYPYTIAFLVKIADYNSQYRFLGSGESGGSGGLEIFSYDTGSGPPYAGNIGANDLGVATIALGTTQLGTGAYHLVAITLSSSAWALYIDGVGAGSGSNSTPLTAGRTFILGARAFSGSPNSGIVGFLGDTMIFSSVLNSTDLTSLHGYYVSKWATP